MFSKRIIGTWSASYPAKFEGDISYYGEGTYYQNGKMLGWNKIYLGNGEIIENNFDDTWRIENGSLILTPAIRYEKEHLNVVTKDLIESISEKEMILINPQGKRLIRNRVQ